VFVTQKVTGLPATAAFLRMALKQFAATLHRQSEQQTGVVDVFANAIRELTHELQKARARSRAIETRLEAAENRIEHLESVVAALTRQGWLQ
jgi:predicted  nucleic acid-binding Zn-ribbon protein